MRILLFLLMIWSVFSLHGDIVDEMVCLPCPDNFFCTDGSNFQCPNFSVSYPSQFPSSIDDCICEGGYERVLDTCLVGQPPDYYIEGDRISCPANMLTVNTLADAATDCVCQIGYEVNDNICQKCDFGKFKGVSGNESCTNCLAGSHASQRGMAACTECPVDTFSLSGDQFCTQCKENSQSAAGSDEFGDCKCNAGYADDVLVCEACSPGKYKDIAANQDCSDCPDNSYSASTSVFITDCTCNAGFTGPDGTDCLACELGEFKDASGSQNCASCAADTFANATGSTFCHPCMNSSTSPVGSTGIDQCTCDIGHARIGTELAPICSSCEPGKKASGLGCVDCSVSEFSTEYGQTECQQCPQNTSAYVVPRTSCQCDPGFRCREGSECHGDCIFCTENTFADTGAWREECSACQPNSVSVKGSPTQDNCQCVPGFIEAAPHVCEACLPGTYSSGFDDQSCITCAGDYVYTPVHPITSQDGCLSCSLCPDDQYDAAPCQGALPPNCQFCPANTGTWQSATASNPNIGQQSCSCDANFYGDLGGPCYECQLPKTRSDGNIAQATDISTCLCPVGMFHVNDTACGVCAVGTYKSEVSNAESCSSCADTFTTSGTQSTSITSCMCPAGTRLQQDTCTECPVDTFKTGISNVSQCTSCRLNSVSNASSTLISDCKCIPGWTLVGDFCEPCEAGTIKDWHGNEACSICPVDTFEPNTQSTRSECLECAANETTNGFVQSTQCICVAGFEFNSLVASCQECPVGEYRNDLVNQLSCQICTKCDIANQRPDLDAPCTSTTDQGCKDCQEDSNLPFGDYTSTFCNCNAGFEANETADSCLECSAGTFKSTNSNNSIPCQTCEVGKRALNSGAAVCDPCDSHCPGGEYVSEECTPTTRIECTSCTICLAGNYSRSSDGSTDDTTCGVNFFNGRSDTVCHVCEENFYCLDSIRYSCGTNGTSAAGSDAEEDCSCEAGFYREDSLCKQCQQNHFCTDGLLRPCPENSLNLFVGGSHITDCNCLHGFFRTNLTVTNFTCKVCLPDDYCEGDNIRRDCPDSLQKSVAGSSELADCICIDGYANSVSNLTCNPCDVNTYCFDGHLFNCSSDRWTQYLQLQAEPSDCVCLPKTFDNNGVCQNCPANSFCPGDNIAHSCPQDSISPAGSEKLYDCECKMGFQSVGFPLLTCETCQAGFYKDFVGNLPCEECRVCSAALDQEYEKVACTLTHNAVCDACDPCQLGVSYIHSACQDTQNTVCNPCSNCSYDTEWQRYDCLIDSNRVCDDITFDLTCAIGEYRGRHTRTSDSFCSACNYRDTKFLSLTLHEPKSFGLIYDDEYSCRIRCLGISKLRDPLNHSLGCISCETGNVLLKSFTVETNAEGDEATCSFTCKSGYTRITRTDGTEDCATSELSSSDFNNGAHVLVVSNFERLSSSFRFTVAHSNHSRYAVVVGRSAPQNCDTVRGCCYAQTWRVSTLQQAGFPNAATEDGCSQNSLHPLDSEKIDESTLRFEISDDMLSSVAVCTPPQNGVADCRLVVSLVDMIMWSSTQQEVLVQTRRASQHVAFVGLNQYVPLKEFEVEVLKAYYTDGGGIVYLVKTQIRGYSLSASIRVSGMTRLPSSDVRECARLSLSESSIVLESNSLSISETKSEYVTYWLGSTDIVSAYYTLNMNDGSDQDIVAVRNMTEIAPYCSNETHTARFDLAQIWGTSGLGADAVYQLHSVSHPTQFTQGELGTLTSFVVQAYNDIPVTIALQNLLGAYTTIQEYTIQNATMLHQGNLDFTYEFRQRCRLPENYCAYEYLLHRTIHNDVHMLHNCSEGQKTLAREWISQAYGVMHDDGHVDAMCDRMLLHPTRSSLGLLVQTQHFLDRKKWMPYMNASMNDIHALLWVNFRLTT